MSIRSLVFGCLLLHLAPSALCRDFLESSLFGEEDKVVPDLITLMLSKAQAIMQLPELSYIDDSKESLSKQMMALADTFKSLPKNEHGNLGLPAARYALHRYFAHRNRWFVQGLAPNSSERHAASVFSSLGQSDINGFSLPALAALAKTFGKLIGAELVVHLESNYHVLQQDIEQAVSGRVLKSLARDYMTIYISGTSWAESATREKIEENYQFMNANNRDWSAIMKWIEQTTIDEAKKDPSCQRDDVDSCMFDFHTAVRVVKLVVENYGHYNDRDCHKMKTDLLKMEDPNSGRVQLVDFYSAGLTGAWQFNEPIDYLRDLGALDESKPTQPRVIVTNYLTSSGNCVQTSKFYSVCCGDECEDFFRIIEKHFGAPFADPDQIIHLVRNDPILSISAPTHLGMLRRRLVEISLRYDGKVPIHGRLFAQWMHHVFPQTCSYPQETNKTTPLSPDQWMKEKGRADIKASQEEITSMMRNLPVGATGAAETPTELPGDIPWSDVEDSCVIARPTSAPPTPQQAKYVGIPGVIAPQAWHLEAAGVVVVVVLAKKLGSLSRQKKIIKCKDTIC